MKRFCMYVKGNDRCIHVATAMRGRVRIQVARSNCKPCLLFPVAPAPPQPRALPRALPRPPPPLPPYVRNVGLDRSPAPPPARAPPVATPVAASLAPLPWACASLDSISMLLEIGMEWRQGSGVGARVQQGVSDARTPGSRRTRKVIRCGERQESHRRAAIG